MRALGATPRQVMAELAQAQVLSSLPGPFSEFRSIGLFNAVQRSGSSTPSALWLVITVLGTLLVVAVLTTIPARIGIRRPVAEVLQAEAA